MKFKEPQQKLFLQEYAKHRCIRRAAKTAGVSDMAVFDLRRRSPEFADAMLSAEATYVETIIAAAHERAVDGVDEPIFGQNGQVGTRKRFSDALLLRLLQRYDPAFRETTTTKVEGRVEHALTIDLDALRRLPAEKRTQLREILALMTPADPPTRMIEAEVVDARGA